MVDGQSFNKAKLQQAFIPNTMTALGVAINEYGCCKRLKISSKKLAGLGPDQNMLEAVTV